MVIALCGYMGSGKTTLGKILAKKLNLNFADTDEYIEQKEGKSIPEIFNMYGEEYFREAEFKAINHFAEEDKMILSLGGGLPIYDKNKLALKKMFVVYINSQFEECYKRIIGTDRPIVAKKTKEELKKHFEDRIPHYKAVADYIATGENLETMAEQIALFVKEKI